MFRFAPQSRRKAVEQTPRRAHHIVAVRRLAPGVSVSEGVLQRVHEFNDVHCNDMGMARQRVEFGAQKLE